mgnify:CR=1 FL=1
MKRYIWFILLREKVSSDPIESLFRWSWNGAVIEGLIAVMVGNPTPSCPFPFLSRTPSQISLIRSTNCLKTPTRDTGPMRDISDIRFFSLTDIRWMVTLGPRKVFFSTDMYWFATFFFLHIFRFSHWMLFMHRQISIFLSNFFRFAGYFSIQANRSLPLIQLKGSERTRWISFIWRSMAMTRNSFWLYQQLNSSCVWKNLILMVRSNLFCSAR